MKIRKQNICFLLCFFIHCETFKNTNDMKQVDIGLSEYELFMGFAADEFQEFYHKNGFYPTEWYLLDIDFVYGIPYSTDDPDISPTKEMGKIWNPKNCKFFYEITKANKFEFTISAINHFGIIEYIINEKLKYPIRADTE